MGATAALIFIAIITLTPDVVDLIDALDDPKRRKAPAPEAKHRASDVRPAFQVTSSDTNKPKAREYASLVPRGIRSFS